MTVTTAARALRLCCLLATSIGIGASCDSEEGNDLGGPCTVDEDCLTALVCDVHGGQGSCQRPHEHFEAGLEGASGELED